MWALFTLTVVVLSCVTHALIEERGACVIACDDSNDGDPSGLSPCAEGYVCKSNGCGRTCQKVDSEEKRQLHCPQIYCILVFCTGGYVIDEDGCPTCDCV